MIQQNVENGNTQVELNTGFIAAVEAMVKRVLERIQAMLEQYDRE